MLYHYFGLVFGYLRRRVVLISATLGKPGAHAAVWAGCNAPMNRSWVQGGVFLEDAAALVPSVYIECKGADVPNGYSVASWPMARYGIPVHVHLSRKRGTREWRVTVVWTEGTQTYTKRSQWVEVPHPVIDAVLELMGPSKAVARIGWKKITRQVSR